MLPEPNIAESPTKVFAFDREVNVVMSMRLPRVVVFDNLLSAEECIDLIEESRSRLQTSTVVSDEPGKHVQHPGRISQGMFFRFNESPLVTRLENRIAALLNWPIDFAEPFNVLRYVESGKYDPHYDYFAVDKEGTSYEIGDRGNRVATLITYLRAPIKGGGTIFPDVGLEVAPKMGSAVFFSYDRPDPETKTLHGGLPVIEGEKWIATKWLRQSKFS